MHLKPLSPYSGIWEPLELRELKRQLANVHCGCSFCETYREPLKQQCQRPVKELYKDQEVQSEHDAESSKPVVFVISDQTITEDSYLSPANKPLSCKDQVCPTCAFTLNLFRCGTTKIVKDQESEAKPVICSSEKATGNIVKVLHKTTSYCKPLLKYPLPNMFGVVSSVDSTGSPDRSLREVTFAFNDKFYGYDDLNVSSDKTSPEKSSDDPDKSTDDNSEEEEETGSTSMETKSDESEEMESEEEIIRPRNNSLGVCAHCVDINRYINAISPLGGPEFYTDNMNG